MLILIYSLIHIYATVPKKHTVIILISLMSIGAVLFQQVPLLSQMNSVTLTIIHHTQGDIPDLILSDTEDLIH